MAEGVVDFLEAIDVDHEDRERQPACRRAGKQLRELPIDADAVRQAGQGVVIGQVGDAPLTLGNAALHAIEGPGELAELVGAMAGQATEVVTALDPVGGDREFLDGARDAARQQPGTDQRSQEREGRNREQLPVENRIGLEDLGFAGLQDRFDAGRIAERDDMGEVVLAEQAHRHGAGRGRGGRIEGRCQCLLHGFGERRVEMDPVGRVGGRKGDFEAGQGLEFRGQGLVHAEAHADPADPLRRAHRGEHDLVGFGAAAVDRTDHAFAVGPGEQARERRLSGHRVKVDCARGDLPLQIQGHRESGVDAGTVVEQDRLYGRFVAGGDRLAKAEIGSDHANGVTQLGLAAGQQALEHAGADIEALIGLVERIAARREIDRDEGRKLDRADQRQQEQDQARAETTHRREVPCGRRGTSVRVRSAG